MTNEQVLQKMQRAGFNVTTCGSCGAIKLHEIGESELTCDECRWRSDICDFPDLYTVKSVGGSMTPTEQDKELRDKVITIVELQKYLDHYKYDYDIYADSRIAELKAQQEEYDRLSRERSQG